MPTLQLEFLSGNHCKGYDDMAATNSRIWGGKELSQAQVARIAGAARVLDDRHHRNISQYVQHCAVYRHRQGMNWDVAGMKNDLDPVVDEFIS